MNNKKVLVTVILAGILAFVLAFVLFRTNRPEKTSPEAQKIIKQEELPVKETVDEKTEKTENDIKPEVPEVYVQKVQPKKSKAQDRKEEVVVSPVKETPVLPKLEVKVEENSPEEINPKDFTVPLQYKSENTYKYVYAPTRYSK